MNVELGICRLAVPKSAVFAVQLWGSAVFPTLLTNSQSLRVQHFKIRETDREDFNSSNESTISTSLIHKIAFDGKSEEVVTWLLNLIFQHKNDCRW